MHGCNSTSVLVANAEVNMGEVVECDVGIAKETSPRRAAIEKVQAELREEYDIREERKRELEFLQKGGDPLDYKFGSSALSTSFTDQHPDQFVTSEAKGSFAFTVSPHGESVESSGRPGFRTFERNSFDNLLLYDAEHESSEGGRNSLRPGRSNNIPSELSSQMDGIRKVPEHGNSASVGPPRKAYKRRNRSRPSRDGTRSNSIDKNPTPGSSVPSLHESRDVKNLEIDTENQNTPSNCNSKSTTPTHDVLRKSTLTGGQQDMESNIVKVVESPEDLIDCVSNSLDAARDAIASENPLDEQLNQQRLSGAAKNPILIDSNRPTMEQMTSAVVDCYPSVTAIEIGNKYSSSKMNGFVGKRGGVMAYNVGDSVSCGLKGLDSEVSRTQTSPSIHVNRDEMCTKIVNVDSNGNTKDQILVQNERTVKQGSDFLKEKKETEGIHRTTLIEKELACQSQVENGCVHELNRRASALTKEVRDPSVTEKTEYCVATGLDTERRTTDSMRNNLGPQREFSFNVRHGDSIDTAMSDPPDTGLLTTVSRVTLEGETSGSNTELPSKVDEDSILKEAEIIEAKRKRIMELSTTISRTQIRRISHWDYVLDEMAWLANDFVQERIWKISAAAQISYQVAMACRLRKQGKSSDMEVNKIAHTLAKAVMEFWHSVEERSKELEQQSQKDGMPSVQSYAARFLKSYGNHAELPSSPVRISDSEVLDLPWEDKLTEANLFYTVPPGATETYRKSIESHVAMQVIMGNSMQEEVGTSTCDGAADEGEMSTHDMSPKFGEKKRKHLMHAYGPGSYGRGSDLLPFQCAENKVVTKQQFSLLAKRPGSSFNVSIPTKRVRTASRRVNSPFSAGTSGGIHVPNKADASSGDTNSFQEDPSTSHCGSLIPSTLEVESFKKFEKQLPFDSAEVSMRPKKKKAKHLNVAYEQRWLVGSSFQHGQFQRDHLKKRSESHQLESNGSSGLLGQPMMKKPKIIRQSQDNTYDIIQSFGGSVPSPIATHMSNTSNPNKFMKILGGRDRCRKSKMLKMPMGQPGSGIPWSLFEEQALVVLVHDLGPNWELISDAMNSVFHFKCIFRKAKDCKEHHNFLMDRTSGDGADSAEDSGSSQPYPSSLPGIPKGSARQLFQRLQAPMEEDTLKSHFEKIKMLGKKQNHRETQEIQPNQQPHSSHAIALSQVCPNNLNSPVLTPFDLCETTMAGTDILPLGFQGTNSPNQGTVTSILPTSGASSLQASPNMMLGNEFSQSPGHFNSSNRDGKYVVPRSDEQQRMQQYNQMIPGRNTLQSNISSVGVLPGTDRGVRILPSGNGMGMVGRVNRSMPMARPRLQGIPSAVNSGTMVSPVIAPANMHSGVNPSQGSSMLRPREASHLMRPGLSQDSQRQIVVPDVQIPGTTQGASHFTFPNQISPPLSSYPYSPQPPQVPLSHRPHFQGPPKHAPTPQQQAYAFRLAKEKQLQNRFLQQQQLVTSNSLMPPHVQSQPQLPISSPMQNISQIQPEASSQPLPKQVIRNSQAGGNGLTNQTGKQRQKQQQQSSQANRQHPQQRHLSQANPQGNKVAKGPARGNMAVHQNIPIGPSLVNGVSPHSSNQSLPQQKINSGQKTSQSDNTSRVHVPAVTLSGLPAGHSSLPSSSLAPSRQKLVNQNQSAHKIAVPPNSHINSDLSNTQARGSNSDQHPTSTSDKMDTVATLPQVDSNALNSAVNGSSSEAQWQQHSSQGPKPQSPIPQHQPQPQQTHLL